MILLYFLESTSETSVSFFKIYSLPIWTKIISFLLKICLIKVYLWLFETKEKYSSQLVGPITT